MPFKAYLETGELCSRWQALRHFLGTLSSAFPFPSTSCLP